MAFQISSDVFIWHCRYKPSPSSPPQPTPFSSSPHDDPLTPANLALPGVFKCSLVFVSVIDWEYVCVCVCLHLLSISPCTCVSRCVLAHYGVMTYGGQTRAPLEQKTRQISQSSSCFVAAMTSLSRLMKDKVLNCSSIRCCAHWITDTTLPTHVTERGSSALPIPSPICEH